MLYDVIFWFGLFCAILLVGAVTLVIAVWFIWPAVEAVSITRMTFAYYKKHSITQHSSRLRVWWLWYRDMLGGRRFEAIRSHGWEWQGVGRWSISE
ncbi:hypothetical protein [Escherichia phage Ioannina]|nr:hypothetical protein [Escherichia phage Ioannina]